jgi:hypothetical protein
MKFENTEKGIASLLKDTEKERRAVLNSQCETVFSHHGCG